MQAPEHCGICTQPILKHRVCKACETPIHYQVFTDKKSDRPYNLACGVLCWYCADKLVTLDAYILIRKLEPRKEFEFKKDL